MALEIVEKHFEINEWADYVRGVAPEGDAMGAHLASGCRVCAEAAGFCERLAHLCSNLAASETPEALVRAARSLFTAKLRKPRLREMMQMPGELVFDSFLAPFPAGLRSTWQVGWQGLYRAGDCSLDLRIEPDLQSSRATLIGQISNHAAPEQEIENAPVRLKSGAHVIAETVSNRFGEFQMEYEQKGKLKLSVTLDGGARCLWVPIKKLVSGKSGGK